MFSIAENLATAFTSLILIAREATEKAEQRQERIFDLENKIIKEKFGQSGEIEKYQSIVIDQKSQIEILKQMINDNLQTIKKMDEEIDYQKKKNFSTQESPSEEKSNPNTNLENHCLQCGTVIPKHRKVCSYYCRSAWARQKAKESKATTTEETENQGK